MNNVLGSRGRRRLAVALLILLAICAALEIYARGVDDFSVHPLALPRDTRSVVLIFHGSKDGDDPLLDEIVAAWPRTTDSSVGDAVLNYDWSAGADNRIRAASNGVRLGNILGRELAGLPGLESLMLVAHSAGAAVPDALCSTYRKIALTPARIEIAFLDPFGIRGFFDWGYGARKYGECADFAVAYINTEDPAPATNAALRHAFNVDITTLPRPEGFERNGHYWPLKFFATRLRAGALPRSDHSTNPRGQQMKLPAD